MSTVRQLTPFGGSTGMSTVRQLTPFGGSTGMSKVRQLTPFGGSTGVSRECQLTPYGNPESGIRNHEVVTRTFRIQDSAFSIAGSVFIVPSSVSTNTTPSEILIILLLANAIRPTKVTSVTASITSPVYLAQHSWTHASMRKCGCC